MNDFEYDSYRKKSIAHSAARRKGGSKSRKCPLSTDYMTPKQWGERCGTIMQYQLGKPMLWAEFTKLPRDLKEEYMNNLIEKYSANARSMADMFGVSVATVFRAVKNENLRVEFLKGRYPTGNKKVEFERFLKGEPEIDSWAPEESAEESQAVEPENVTTDLSSDEEPSKTKLDGFTMNFSGQIDIDMVANSLRYILGNGRNAKIHIICEIE